MQRILSSTFNLCRRPPAFWLIVFPLCYSFSVWGQDDKGGEPGSNLDVFNPIYSKAFQLSVILLITGVVFFFGQIYLLRRVTNITSDDVIKNCSITIVVIAAAFLIVAGYNSQQTAQAFGLFGTLIGYLLGRSAGRNERREERKEDENR
jgi:hypothetical protein